MENNIDRKEIISKAISESGITIANTDEELDQLIKIYKGVDDNEIIKSNVFYYKLEHDYANIEHFQEKNKMSDQLAILGLPNTATPIDIEKAGTKGHSGRKKSAYSKEDEDRLGIHNHFDNLGINKKVQSDHRKQYKTPAGDFIPASQVISQNEHDLMTIASKSGRYGDSFDQWKKQFASAIKQQFKYKSLHIHDFSDKQLKKWFDFSKNSRGEEFGKAFEDLFDDRTRTGRIQLPDGWLQKAIISNSLEELLGDDVEQFSPFSKALDTTKLKQKDIIDRIGRHIKKWVKTSEPEKKQQQPKQEEQGTDYHSIYQNDDILSNHAKGATDEELQHFIKREGKNSKASRLIKIATAELNSRKAKESPYKKAKEKRQESGNKKQDIESEEDFKKRSGDKSNKENKNEDVKEHLASETKVDTPKKEPKETKLKEKETSKEDSPNYVVHESEFKSEEYNKASGVASSEKDMTPEQKKNAKWITDEATGVKYDENSGAGVDELLKKSFETKADHKKLKQIQEDMNKTYDKVVSDPNFRFAFVGGAPGLGKTFGLKKLASDENAKRKKERQASGSEEPRDIKVHIPSTMTKAGLIDMLYKQNSSDNIIVIDDKDDIWQDPEMINIIKTATNTNGADRVIQAGSKVSPESKKKADIIKKDLAKNGINIDDVKPEQATSEVREKIGEYKRLLNLPIKFNGKIVVLSNQKMPVDKDDSDVPNSVSKNAHHYAALKDRGSVDFYGLNNNQRKMMVAERALNFVPGADVDDTTGQMNIPKIDSKLKVQTALFLKNNLDKIKQEVGPRELYKVYSDLQSGVKSGEKPDEVLNKYFGLSKVEKSLSNHFIQEFEDLILGNIN